MHLDAIHYGKRHACGQCGKEFKYVQQLRMHIKKKHPGAADEGEGEGEATEQGT